MTRFQKYLTKELDKLQVDYIIKDGKLIIAQELQSDKDQSFYANGEFFKLHAPIQITEWNYSCSLSEELQELNDRIDKKFDRYFECEYPYCFSVHVQQLQPLLKFISI